ncbi:multidrug resistance protein [Scheffersomyces coipomensis]|uniref:multidrug resistance protein n=1 Tax=Scheffersomyces coipomensis TaxID=1788519 RepID=UPI00315D659E
MSSENSISNDSIGNDSSEDHDIEKLPTPGKSKFGKDGLSSNSTVNEFQGFNDATAKSVQELARTLTHDSISSNTGGAEDFQLNEDKSSNGLIRYLSHMSQIPGVSPYNDDDINDRLNPYSDSFDAKFWVKNLRKLFDSDPDYYKPSKLGIAYRDLRAYGVAVDSDYQPTVTNALWKTTVEALRSTQKKDDSRYFNILKSMDAIMKPGEVTVVLGRPGSGCSTLLKTIACNTYGFQIGEESRITYDGLTPEDIQKHHRGDVVYSAETDVHFPHLSVGNTLEFAARLRTPHNRGLGVDRETYAKHMASVYMATYGLSHTRDTNVGNEFVRGVSGGERKRVSIAEVSLCGANLQCWDNATRGLDAATALEFIRALKKSATILEATPLIAIYQCSQDAYDLFDNVVVLYEGYQIFFGKADKAKEYFVNMGWDYPQRQTTADFLTSLTNPTERIPRQGFEYKVPNTAEEFEAYWRKSPEYKSLINEIDQHFIDVEVNNSKQSYHDSHVARQSKNISPKSPYTVSFFMQVRYLMGRNILQLKGDPSIAIGSICGNFVMGLILSSVFFNLQETTSSFYYRGAAMFFAVLFNAFSSVLEIMLVFISRPIVEKHKKYALYRPSADALAGIITQLPVKLCVAFSFNLVFYFMVHFRREPGAFFFYLLMCFTCTLVMSHIFRAIGSIANTLASAMTPATVMLLAMIIYTGFAIPVPKMLGWSRWISYINPVGYVFESLMVNEFYGREFTCSTKVPAGPGYSNLDPGTFVCNTVGSVAGSPVVSGTTYLAESYSYFHSHRWRNWGIAVAYVVVFLFVYIGLTEYNKGAMQKGEIVLFLKGSLKKYKQQKKIKDAENLANEKVPLGDQIESTKPDNKVNDNSLPSSNDIFHWRDLTYQIRIKKEDRTILNQVDGWVKPGQITALMGASGAGKTTLLNCLSERVTTGVITDGVRMVNGHSLDSSFQRSIGYVQQQDLHLPTSTVREAFRFSAYLRQPASVPISEKNDYVEYIIDLLEMTEYADAIVGVAGEGLNVEQRKRLTIGVELVSKPKLLLFLDEPTSGLDSQTAWSICKLMRKLADHGQAILCTIHQPSALLLKEFDRLLFLQSGGQTVYFGDLGDECSSLIKYFEKYGADPCPPEANPAEWMLEVVGAAPGSHAKQDYFEVWRNSDEFRDAQIELDKMERELVHLPRDTSAEAHLKYAAPIWRQYLIVSWRVLQEKWRSPSYIYSKVFLIVSSALFNGFSFFMADNSMQGLQNQMFAIFMYLIVFNTLIQQMAPYFIIQRDLYEVREAPSRTYSWFAFITGQITSEIPFQIVCGAISFFCWYYPVGLYRNAIPTDQVNSRGVLMWMFLTAFLVYATSMGQLCLSFIEVADNAVNLATILSSLCLNFCGVLAGPEILPRFWIFMYRANPFTYLMQGILATGLANTNVICAEEELLVFNPPSGETCGSYMAPYMSFAGGYLTDINATSGCQFCQMGSTNVFLTSVNAHFSQRWRNFGIFVSFIGINIILTIIFYWAARVPKRNREKKKVKKDQ